MGKRVFCAGLALAMTIGLAACGGSDTTSTKTGSGKAGKGNANASLAKENVYKLQEIDIPQFVDTDSGYVDVRQTVQLDGRVYMLLRVQDWSTDETKISLLSMKVDGSDVQNVWLSLPGEDEEENAGSEGSTEDGSAASAEGAVDEIGDVEDDMDYNSWDYSSYNNFTMTEDGIIYGLRYEAHEEYYYSNPDNNVSEQHDYVCCWDRDGALLWEMELEGIRSIGEDDEYFYPSKIFSGEDGSLNILLTGDNVYCMNVSSDGTEVSEKKKLSEEASEILNYYQYLLPKEDGSFLVVYSDENDWTKTYVTNFDFETGATGEVGELPSSLSWNGYDTMNAGVTNDLVYSNSTGIYSYSIGDADSALMMNYINSDVYITGLAGFAEVDENSFIALYYENYESELKAGLFTYVSPEQIADRSVIVIAGTYFNSDMLTRVVEFNRTNENYRIVTKDYSQYNSYDDYEASYTQLNNDIITGGMPDILLASNMPVENYIAKGLIADLNPLIEADEELSQKEFLQNVFDAYSVDGKLYYLIPRFYVGTMVAKTELVGDGSDWSMDKMQQIVESMGEDAQAISDVTRDNFISMALQFCGSDFVDVETGKCRFDSDDFIAMMEFAKTLPEEIDWDERYSDDNYWSTYESQYRENRTLLMNLTISSLTDLNYDLNGYLGADFTFVGFPTEEGSGSYIYPMDALVLSAKSDCLEGAWEFVRYYLTDEYQENIGYALPVNKEIFLQQAEKGTKRPTYTDYGTGEEIEYDQTFYINGEEITLEPLSQEQMDQIVAFVESIDSPYYNDDDVLNIINEELGSFYSGQKTAKDTAAIIQNRVQLYVEENR